jgi:hypothetical protein
MPSGPNWTPPPIIPIKKTHTQTSMPLVGFEPTIPVFERAKTVHALDRAGTAIGIRIFLLKANVFTDRV